MIVLIICLLGVIIPIVAPLIPVIISLIIAMKEYKYISDEDVINSAAIDFDDDL